MSSSHKTQPQVINSNAKRKGGVFRQIATVVGIVVCVFLVLLLTCNLVLIVKSYVNKDNVPSVFGISPMYVLTGSMEPTINGGDLVFVKQVAAQDIALNDVIAFFDPTSDDDAVVVHRVQNIIVDEQGNIFFFTKGDFNNKGDSVGVPADSLVGQYVGRLPYMGRVAMFMQTTSGLIICVSVPLLLLIGFELIRILRSRNRNQSDDTNTSM